MIQGGFGSSGAGNRTGRRKMTRAGEGGTRMIEELGLRPKPTNMIDASADEIHRAIRTGFCCFCDSMKEYKSIGHHWSMGHGFNLQDIRDTLGVWKRFPLASEELRATQSKNSKRLYPSKAKGLHAPRKHDKRNLSAFGRAAQRKKALAIPPETRIKAARKEGKRRAKENRDSGLFDRVCVVCEKTFHRSGHGEARSTIVCSWECRSIHLGNRLRGRVYEDARKYKNCRICDARYHGPGETCGDEKCIHELRSRNAAARTDHIKAWQAASMAARAAKPTRYCEVEGCDRKYLVKEMCSLHDQRRRAAIKKEAVKCEEQA